MLLLLRRHGSVGETSAAPPHTERSRTSVLPRGRPVSRRFRASNPNLFQDSRTHSNRARARPDGAGSRRTSRVRRLEGRRGVDGVAGRRCGERERAAGAERRPRLRRGQRVSARDAPPAARPDALRAVSGELREFSPDNRAARAARRRRRAVGLAVASVATLVVAGAATFELEVGLTPDSAGSAAGRAARAAAAGARDAADARGGRERRGRRQRARDGERERGRAAARERGGARRLWRGDVGRGVEKPSQVDPRGARGRGRRERDGRRRRQRRGGERDGARRPTTARRRRGADDAQPRPATARRGAAAGRASTTSGFARRTRPRPRRTRRPAATRRAPRRPTTTTRPATTGRGRG